ncbi:MAG: ABC transporter permease subunit [Chloroflexota bacterium]
MSAAPGGGGVATGPAGGSAVIGPHPFGAIVGVTTRAVLSRRRTLLVLLFVAAPVLLALLARAVGATSDVSPNEIAIALGDALILHVVLPIVALLFGTAVIGAEIDDGTIVYLISKPVPRLEIVLAKLLVAEAVTLALVVPMTLATTLIVLAGAPGADLEIVAGSTVGVAVGAIVYVAIFVAMSVLTSRALVLGLAYVLIWEGFLASLFAGTRNLSVREYAVSIGGWIAGQSIADTEPIAVGLAAGLAVAVTIIAVAITIRRLGSYEVKDGG